MADVVRIMEGDCALKDAAGCQKVVQFPSVSAGASFLTAVGEDTIACRVAVGCETLASVNTDTDTDCSCGETCSRRLCEADADSSTSDAFCCFTPSISVMVARK